VASSSYLNKYGHLIAIRDGGWFCHYCASELIPRKAQQSDDRYYRTVNGERVPKEGLKFASVDHILPRSQGGHSDPHNMVLACRDCNSARSSTPYKDFMDSVAKTGVWYGKRKNKN
jgi:5-methylcytosine-specific restriction endonuclease McrA